MRVYSWYCTFCGFWSVSKFTWFHMDQSPLPSFCNFSLVWLFSRPRHSPFLLLSFPFKTSSLLCIDQGWVQFTLNSFPSCSCLKCVLTTLTNSFIFDTTHLITISIVLPLPECHTVVIIQNSAFSGWLLSLSNIQLSFLHVFSWLDSSFLFISV